MARVLNAVEILPKFEPPEYGARKLQTDRRQTDGRAIAYSERMHSGQAIEQFETNSERIKPSRNVN